MNIEIYYNSIEILTLEPLILWLRKANKLALIHASNSTRDAITNIAI